MTSEEMDAKLLEYAGECTKCADILFAINPTATWAIGTLVEQAQDLKRRYRESHEQQLTLNIMP